MEHRIGSLASSPVSLNVIDSTAPLFLRRENSVMLTFSETVGLVSVWGVGAASATAKRVAAVMNCMMNVEELELELEFGLLVLL